MGGSEGERYLPPTIMIGIVVVSHGTIGAEMVRVAKSIVRDSNPMIGLAIEHDENVNQAREKIEKAILEIHQAGGSEGILLLSDMFGGTPSNLCLSFLKEGEVEVIAGINLPIIIKLASLKEKKTLSEIAHFIKDYGQKNITLASEILKAS